MTNLIFKKMDDLKKYLIKYIVMPGLTLKQKAIVWYFAISLFLLCGVEDGPILGIVILVLNFANAARLIKQVPIPEDDE